MNSFRFICRFKIFRIDSLIFPNLTKAGTKRLENIRLETLKLGQQVLWKISEESIGDRIHLYAFKIPAFDHKFTFRVDFKTEVTFSLVTSLIHEV